MKKSLLIVLLVIFAFTLWTVVAFGKANKTEKPIQKQKTEQNVEPQFPKVVLPPEGSGEVLIHGTAADLEKMVQAKKAKTLEQMQKAQGQPVQLPAANATEAMPNYCVVTNQDPATCCYRSTNPNLWLACWTQVRFTTMLDIDNNVLAPACAFPYYPFHVDTVTTDIYSFSACSLQVYARVYGSRFIGTDCRFPSGLVGYSDTFWVQHPGATLRIKIPIIYGSSCVYGPFFPMVYILNDDQFVDPTYCPYDSVTTPFTGLSWIYDLAAKKCQSYWGSPIAYPGYLYDIVSNNMAGGTVRVRATGHTAGDPLNACTAPANEWYYKDSLAAAPGGLPDFDQGQMPPAFCGPTAGADVLYWQFANNGIPVPAAPALISELAAASGTIPGVGTVCDALEAGILAVAKAHGGWWLNETTVYNPTFVYIQAQTTHLPDLTLLLGFWQDDGTGLKRFGGHFVGVSGVDIFAPTYQVALSDPAMDNAETGGPGVVYPHPDAWPHVGNFTVHNNPADVSKDWYPVAWPSANPSCGYVYLPTYIANWPDFQGQNAGPCPNTGTFNPTFPVLVLVEQSISVYPGQKELKGQVNSSDAHEIESNIGGINEWFVKLTPADTTVKATTYAQCGSIYLGTSQADLAGVGQNYYPGGAFLPTGAPVCDSFYIYSAADTYKVEQCTYTFLNPFDTCLAVTKYAFGFWPPDTLTHPYVKSTEDVFVVKNVCTTPVNGIAEALLIDLDGPSGGGDLAGFDQTHQTIWMTDIGDTNFHFGITQKPVGAPMLFGHAIDNANRVWKDHLTWDSLYYWMENLGWGKDAGATDYGYMLSDAPFDLNPGSFLVNKFLKWGYYDSTGTQPGAANLVWRTFLYKLLYHEGYYRGDVNQDGKFDVGDIIYLINFMYKGGPKPKEFVDQGDVNSDGNVNVQDLVIIINNRFKGGLYPIDKNRFLDASPFVDPAFKAAAVKNPGLFADPNWKNLGQ